MRHLRRSALLSFDAGELSPRKRSRTARHLRDCERCRGRLSRLREIRDLARRATEVPAPDSLEEIQRRLDAGERLILPRVEAPAGKRRRTVPRRAVTAALVAAFLTAASVAAATGRLEPMTRWVLDRVGAVSLPVAPQAGVEVPVPSEGMTVELRDVGPDLLLRVERTEGALLQILGTGGASAARFSTGARVAVTGARTGQILIRVPRSAGPVRVISGRVTLVTVTSHPYGTEDTPAVEVRVGDVLH